MSEDGRKVELCALWKNESKGGETYYSGTLGGARVLVFKNKNKGDNEKAPDLKVYLVPIEPKGGFVKGGPKKVTEELEKYEGFAEKDGIPF